MGAAGTSAERAPTIPVSRMQEVASRDGIR